MSQLATSGDDLKIWDTLSYECLHQYTPPCTTGSSSSGVSSNSWSSDTSCVSSILKGQDKIVLNYSKNSKYIPLEISLEGISKPTVLRFPKTTQKDVMLSAGSYLYVYDISKHKKKKFFQLKNNVTSFAVNHSDSYVATGCSDGTLNLINITTNQISKPLVAPKCNGQKLTCVKYNLVKPSLLGASCESGVVSFWDCNVDKNLFNISPHCAPVSAMTFSPINDTLALSVGLDKKLICCDVKTKKIIMSIQCDNPLTAADFEMDGTKMAVGTSRGRVLVYDLRSPKAPMKSFVAHNTSVNSMVFKHKVDKNQVAQVMSVVKSRSKLSQQKSTTSLQTVQEEGKENAIPLEVKVMNVKEKVETDGVHQEEFNKTGESVFSKEDSLFVTNNRRDSLSSQLFSPLRDADTSFPGNQSHSTSSLSKLRSVSEVRLSTEGIFSPLRDANSPVSPFYTSTNRKTPYSSFTTTPAMSPLTSIREEGTHPTSASPQKSPRTKLTPDVTKPEKLCLEKLDHFVKEASAGEKSPMFVKDALNALDTAISSGASKSLGSEKGFINGENLDEISKHGLSNENNGKKSDFLNVLTAFPDLGFENEGFSQSIRDAAENVAERLSTTTDSGVASFQKNYIRSVVSEAMEDWCIGVERRLWGLQYSLLRQMQQNQEETKALMMEFSGLGELQHELLKLRNENSELKKFFGHVEEGGYVRDN